MDAKNLPIELLDKMGMAVRENYAKSITPIVQGRVVELSKSGTKLPVVRVCGTGTLVQINQTKLLVTAAHVVRRNIEAGWGLGILNRAQAGGRNELVFLPGKFGTVDKASNEDPYPEVTPLVDVAIYVLPPEIADQLPNRTFISLAHFDIRHPVDFDFFEMYGYPAQTVDWSADLKNQTINSFECGTLIFDGDLAPAMKAKYPMFSKHDHFPLAVPRKMTRLDGSVNEVNFLFHGMSGSPVFQMYRNGSSADNWTPNDIRIVGVFAGKVSGEAFGEFIRVTNWRRVAEAICTHVPELHPFMRLNRMGEDDFGRPPLVVET